MSFSLDIIQTTLVKKTKPGVVRVYDYYDPGNDIRFFTVVFLPTIGRGSCANKTDSHILSFLYSL